MSVRSKARSAPQGDDRYADGDDDQQDDHERGVIHDSAAYTEVVALGDRLHCCLLVIGLEELEKERRAR